MKWASRALCFLGLIMLGAALAGSNPVQAGLPDQCTGTWNCKGTVFNGCTYKAGSMPSCDPGNGPCEYNVPHPCSGTDGNNAPCSANWFGCN